MTRAAAVVLSAILPAAALAADAPLRLAGSTVRFASAEETARLLAGRDAYVAATSAADRARAAPGAAHVTEEAFLAFARDQARAWTDPERAALEAAVADLGPRVAALDVPLPPEIVLAKTSGRESPWQLYRRGEALFFGERVAGPGRIAMRQMLAGQLWHLASARAPGLRREAAALIGFTPCAPPPLPADLEARRITNPSAPARDLAMELRPGTWVQPVGLAPRVAAGAAAGPGEDDDPYRLLVLEKVGAALRPRVVDGAPQLLEARVERAYLDRLGRNTDEVYDPETVLAQNFELMVLGVKTVRPELTRALRALFERKVR